MSLPQPPHPERTIVGWSKRFVASIASRSTTITTVLDVAAGSGRHSRLFLDLGCAVTAVDRNIEALQRHFVNDDSERIEIVECDLELDLEEKAKTNDGSIQTSSSVCCYNWPFDETRRWDVIVVTNYLWRPLLPRLAAALADGGVLMYETFMVGNERFGRPRNKKFLLSQGELLAFAQNNEHLLDVVEFSQGEVVGENGTPAAVRQRLLARRKSI